VSQVTVEGVYEVPDHADVHLIELTVDVPASQVDPGKFTQEVPGQPQSEWQVAWDEWYLDPDSGQPLGQSPMDAAGMARTRLAFFLHSMDRSRPLVTPFGPIELPTPTAAPTRLSPIGYEPVD
jgi:hypothetical protein